MSAAASSWTIGNKRILVLRLEFPDRVDATATEQQCRDMMEYADRLLQTNSYGAFSLTATISPVVKMPKPEIEFTGPAEIETVAWQLALNAGIHREDFDLDVIVGLSQLDVDAYGNVGIRGIVLKRAEVSSTVVHEIGHNLGLLHARAWVGYYDSISGAGESREYGDPFDIMGLGNRSFSSWGKWRLGWIRAESVRDVTNSQTIDITLHETPSLQPGATYALRIPAGDKTYWIDCQLPTTLSPQTADFILVRWSPQPQNTASTHLLDMRPETPSWPDDSGLLLGRTFSDRARKVHITPVKKLQNGFSVEVNIGAFPSNRPPMLTISAPRVLELQPGAALELSADASDPDGEPVSVVWDFNDGSFGIGSHVTHSFVANGEYSVVCEASDHKGGVTMKSFVARVGSPSTYRLGGIVTHKGAPLPNARIYVPGQENLTARTDPDGHYVLTGLRAGSVTLIGAFEGMKLRPVNFALPYNVSGTQDNVDWEFVELLADDLQLTILEDSEPTAIRLSAKARPDR